MVKSSADNQNRIPPPPIILTFVKAGNVFIAGDYVIITGTLSNNTFGYNLFEGRQDFIFSGEGYRSSEESLLWVLSGI